MPFRLMKDLLFTMAAFFFSACKPDDNQKLVIDTSIEISVTDQKGSDLLNPDNPDAFRKKEITLYYLKNGEMVKVYNPDMDYPGGFMLFEHQPEYRIRIFPNDTQNDERPVTYINWNGSDMDTIVCKFQRTGNTLVCTEVWFNDQLKWQQGQSERFFSIVK